MAATEPTLFYLAVLSGPLAFAAPLETVHAHCVDKSQRAYESALASIVQTPGFRALLAAGKSRLEVAIEPCGLPQTCWVRVLARAPCRLAPLYLTHLTPLHTSHAD